MESLNHVNIEPYISSARLATYQQFFQPNNDVELFGCYLWNKDVVSAFFPLIQLVEVAIRNAIHKEATQKIGTYWFDNIATQSRNRLTREQIGNIDYHHKSIANARRAIRKDLNLSNTATISADRIIAKMTFGFWTNLLRVPFEVNRNNSALWPTLIRPVFPNLAKRYRTRANIQTKLLAIQTLRNKAFHHEPIWNIGKPSTVENAIDELHKQKDLLLMVLNWLSIDAAKLAKRSGYIHQVERVCSLNYLTYLQHSNSREKPISVVKRELNSLIRNDDLLIDITKRNVKIAKIISSKY